MFYRKPPLTAACLAGDAFFIGGFVYVAFDVPQPGLFGVAVIFTGLTYLLWLVGWHSAIQLGQSGVVVDNGLTRHEIAWRELSDIGIGYGLTFRLRNGTEVRSVMFGGSVMGAIIGYRYTESIAKKMRQYRKELLVDDSEESALIGYRSGVHIPWLPLLTILVAFEIIAAIAVIAK
jgi:hypothetical protein